MSAQSLLVLFSLTETLRDGAYLAAGLQLAAAALILAGLMGVFRKAGRNPLACLVPILAERNLLAIVDGSMLWLIPLLLPLVGFGLRLGFEPPLPAVLGLLGLIGYVAQLVTFVLLAQRFRTGTGFYLGTVLLPFVFLPILGLSRKAYHPPFRAGARRRRAGAAAMRAELGGDSA